MKLAVGAAAILAAAGAATAQFGPMGGMGGASAFRGIWSPTVGQGGEYQIDQKNGRNSGPSDMTIAIVGKEDVSGQPGVWMEITTKEPRSGNTMYMKFLVVTNGGTNQNVKMIMQQPPQPPMEMDLNGGQMMGHGRAAQPQSSDVSKEGKDLGVETITVPAGTFSCEHYQSAEGDDVWVSKTVSPWGLVKMTGKDTDMVLEKVITDAHDMITGTPQVFQMPNVGGMGGPPQH